MGPSGACPAIREEKQEEGKGLKQIGFPLSCLFYFLKCPIVILIAFQWLSIDGLLFKTKPNLKDLPSPLPEEMRLTIKQFCKTPEYRLDSFIQGVPPGFFFHPEPIQQYRLYLTKGFQSFRAVNPANTADAHTAKG